MVDDDDDLDAVPLFADGRPLFWRLDGETVKPASAREFAEGTAVEQRRIGYDRVGATTVSTVFLAVDHGIGRTREPVLFETMLFGGPWMGMTWRYQRLDEAVNGHYRIVESLRRGDPPQAR